ncbi:MAG: hypothetical protein KBE93_04055 [Tidjanibacter sp.]|nr:hypothetical protein [Tidjanibacter sp.]MBS1323273.1 hypothetical protein [Rikenellaceae bacterium]MBP8722303.1 hypothetical protein [Tidjanibacter sp.]MBP9547081.1 hypothetical protein [Tidjanibacter sp.]MBP9959669.1 hypothetical protein [Tidjanibacter sp.]
MRSMPVIFSPTTPYIAR